LSFRAGFRPINSASTASSRIESTAWRGVFRQGKAKTTSSKAPVIIPDVILPLLTAWREQNQTAPTDALIFPTERATPMRPEN
jgi:hypothetical protein